jgi:DNA mismatch repair ATPase MutL
MAVVVKRTAKPSPAPKTKTKVEMEDEDLDDEVDEVEVDEDDEEEEAPKKSSKKAPAKKASKVVEEDDEDEDEVDEDEDDEDEEEEAPKKSSKKAPAKKASAPAKKAPAKKEAPKKEAKKDTKKDTKKATAKKAPKKEAIEVPYLGTMKRDDLIKKIKENLVAEEYIASEEEMSLVQANKILKAVEATFGEVLNNLSRVKFGDTWINRSKINGRFYSPVLEQAGDTTTYVPPHYKMMMTVEPKEVFKGTINKKNVFEGEEVTSGKKITVKVADLDSINEEFFSTEE